jgi:hypothetical protein
VSAELGDAQAAGGTAPRGWRGEPLGPLAFVVSSPSSGDPGDPLGGEAGVAADKAAAALGAGAGPVFVVTSAPAPGMPAEARRRRLSLTLEAADPRVVMALDGGAARDLADAYGLDPMEPGAPARVRGRVLGSAGDFVASLGDVAAKARVWAAMRAIASEGGLKATGHPKAPRDGRSDSRKTG